MPATTPKSRQPNYRLEYQRRYREALKVPCRNCGKRIGRAAIGQQCQLCRRRLVLDRVREPEALQPEREERIRRYTERADKNLPLFVEKMG